MKIGKIQKPVGSLEILVHLHRNKKATITDLITKADLNQRTAYSALSKLQDQKLITRNVGKGFPMSKYYGLTRKGRVVAGHLDTVDKLLK